MEEQEIKSCPVNKKIIVFLRVKPNDIGVPPVLNSPGWITFLFDLITLSTFGLVVVAAILNKRDRKWPTWVGMIAGIIPTDF